jgi:beta-glucosidase
MKQGMPMGPSSVQSRVVGALWRPASWGAAWLAAALACLPTTAVAAEAPASLEAQATTEAPASADRPWLYARRDVLARTRALLAAMTQEEKLTLVFGYFSSDAPWKDFKRPVAGLPQAAGFIPGNARLGIPSLNETDAGIGVASQPGPQPRLGTALPANLAIAASWDERLAFQGGRMIGGEAHASGFNVMLAGGIDLARDPRNGRNFEYGGEDPWLAAVMVGAQVSGIQSNHLIATIKHFAFNDQESSRKSLNVVISDRSARMSDLLAFELAIERAHPGSVMCAYNRINGVYSCESPWLLDEVLKRDWGYPGFVMSDWGGVHSTIPAANAGLDQDSGFPFDDSPYFSAALREAVADRYVPQARLDDMAARILRSMFANGLFDDPAVPAAIDFDADGAVSRAAAEGGIVLLKNARQILPLQRGLARIALIGGHADFGVLAGGGSSQVYAPDSWVTTRGDDFPMVYYASSPMRALASRTAARLSYEDGNDVAAAARLAARSDVAIVFATQWSEEGSDHDLALGAQDALIAAVARANPRTVVVLETGGPVTMPWLSKVAGVVEAWFPGSRGGEAIARVLSGEVDASGRLPLSFPVSAAQLPRPRLDGYPDQPTNEIPVDYEIEGAAVGYKWFDRENREPLFSFGYGLSYTKFGYSDLHAEVQAPHVHVSFAVENTGDRSGAAVPEIYVAPAPDTSAAAGWESPKRLGAFDKVTLAPGASAHVDADIDPRLFATYDESLRRWLIAAGDYEVVLATDSRTPVLRQRVRLPRLVLDEQGAVAGSSR